MEKRVWMSRRKTWLCVYINNVYSSKDLPKSMLGTDYKLGPKNRPMAL